MLLNRAEFKQCDAGIQTAQAIGMPLEQPIVLHSKRKGKCPSI
jgi:hypothetical protein